MFEIWRHAKLNDAAFNQCVRVYRLPDADILGAGDFKNDKHMQDFAHHVGGILHVMADTLQAQDFGELMRHGFA